MPAGFSRRTKLLAFASALAGLIACRGILGIERGHEASTTPADAGSTADVEENPTESLPPLGQEDASCGDTTKDPKNCGACGRDCRGGKCASGRCAPVVFVFERKQPTELVVTTEAVYWVDHDDAVDGNAVRRCDIDGCPPEGPRTLFTLKGGTIRQLVVEGSYVYAVTWDGKLYHCGLLGCSDSPALLTTAIARIQVAGGRMYFQKQGGINDPPGVWQCTPPFCSSPKQIYAKGTTAALLGSDLYVLDRSAGPTGSLVRCPNGDCTSPTSFATNLVVPADYFVASNHGVAWQSYVSPDMVVSVCEPKSCAGGPRMLAKSFGFSRFAFDDRYLYTLDSEYSTVQRIAWDKTSQPVEDLLTQQGLPTGIAMLDGVLYFTRRDFGDIVRYVPPP